MYVLYSMMYVLYSMMHVPYSMMHVVYSMMYVLYSMMYMLYSMMHVLYIIDNDLIYCLHDDTVHIHMIHSIYQRRQWKRSNIAYNSLFT